MIVAFINIRSRVGKTVSAYNCALEWAHAGKRVLLVDLDFQGYLTNLVAGITPEKEWPTGETNLLSETRWTSIRNCIKPSRHTNLDYIPSDLRMAWYEQDLSYRPAKELHLKNSLETLNGLYDIILLDCPPSVGLLTYSALIAADAMVLVSTLDSQSIEGLWKAEQLCRDVYPIRRSPIKLAGVLVTMVQSLCEQVDVTDTGIDLLIDKYGPYVVPVTVHRSTDITEAEELCKAVSEYKPGSEAAGEYGKAAHEIWKGLIAV